MTRPDDDRRDSLRSGSYWGSILRALAAAATIRLLVKLGLALLVALVLVVMARQGG